jgi:hypothetical protein
MANYEAFAKNLQKNYYNVMGALLDRKSAYEENILT